MSLFSLIRRQNNRNHAGAKPAVRGRSRLGGELRFERLEHRNLLTITTLNVHEAPVGTDVQDPAGKDILVPVTGADDGNDAISYSVSSSNSAVSVAVVSGDTYLTFNVTAPASGSTPAINGTLTFKLFDSLTPKTVSEIESLVDAGDYNNTTFARVLDSVSNIIVAQGGYSSTGGNNGTGSTFDDEFNSTLTFDSPGMLAMANGGADTNDLEFFVSGVDEPNSTTPLTLTDLAATRSLDYRYTIFGQLVDGFSTFDQIMNSTVEANSSGPNGSEDSYPEPLITVTSASITTNNQDAVLDISAPTSASGDSSTITINATEADGATSTQTFTVDVVANTVTDPPFMGTIQSTVTTSANTPLTITLPATNPSGTTLNYEIIDPTTGAAPTNVTVGSINPATGQVTLTPKTGFTGSISLMAGVESVNSSGQATSSFDTQDFVMTVTAAVAPAAPTHLTATATTTVAINLSWTASTGTVTGYNVYRGTTAGGESTTPLNSTPLAVGTTTYQDTTGAAGVTYYYVVEAVNSTVSSPKSNEASATVPTNPVPPPTAPTALMLASSSETGLFKDDNYTSQATPTVNATAASGDLVTFSVNGKTVTATANSSGLAQAVLPAGALMVGVNSISATTSDPSDTLTSAAAAISMTYAPNDNQIYTVPGAVGASETLVITFASRQAAYHDEIGVYEASGSGGAVDGIAPGAAGYAQAAIGGTANGGQFAQVVFASGDNGGETENITVTGGEKLGFYMIQNNTTANFLANNPSDKDEGNDIASLPLAFFTATAANPDSTQHVQVTANSISGDVQYAWEDLSGGGDKDYNDVVMTVALSTGRTASPAVLQAPGASGSGNQVTLKATLKSGTHDAAAPGDVGVFYVSDPAGDIGSLAPGDPGYLAAALASGNFQVLTATGKAAGAVSQITVPAGQYLAFYSISSGTTANFLSANSANTIGKGLPNAFLTFSATNPDQENHFSWTSPEGVATNPTQTDLHVLDQVYGDASNINDLDLDLSFSAGL